MTIRTVDQWISEAKSLRRQVEVHEERFLRFLIAFEDSGAWEDAGYTTFATLLTQQKLCDATRYGEFRKSVAVIGADTKTVGVPTAVQAIKITNLEARQRYLDEAKARIGEVGTAWSDQAARTARLKFQPDPSYHSQIERKATKLEEAEATIRTLRKEVRAVTRERDELRAKLGALRSPNGTARKAPQTHV